MNDQEMTAQLGGLPRKLLPTARQYLPADAAADAVQDVCLRLWQMRAGLTAPIDGLARVMTRNTCIDRLRRRRCTQPLDEAVACTPGDNEAQATREQVERMMRIVEALPSLPQTVLRLRHMEGMSTEHIAALLGSTPEAVRMALSRARRMVRAQYNKEKQREQ